MAVTGRGNGTFDISVCDIVSIQYMLVERVFAFVSLFVRTRVMLGALLYEFH